MLFWKKMFRDMLSNKGSYLACLVLVAIGLVVFMSFAIASDNLVISRDAFYREQNFAHGFIEVESMPLHRAEELSQVEGVEQVTPRVVEEVRVNKPESRESVYLQLVSVDPGEHRRVNDVKLLEGTKLKEGYWNTWIGDQFFEAHGLQTGEKVEVIIGGSSRELTVVGEAMSPEFTYPLRTEGEFVPNPEQFGIAFLPRDTMWDAFPEMQNRVNDVVFTLEAGHDFEEVRERLEPELEPYGLITVYPRGEQVSHFMLQEEIEALETMAAFLPVMVLAIAGLILSIVLKRLVEQQRGQIGIMKAFGYSNREVLLHYLSYPLVLAVFGGLPGGLAGMWSAGPLSELLFEFFHIPEVYVGFSPSYLALGMVLSLVVLVAGGYLGCRQVLKLKPAEAMRPPAPVSGGRNILEKCKFFAEMLTVQGKMAVRNLGRSRGRSAFMFFGVVVSCAMVAFTWHLVTEGIDRLMFYQYEEVEKYDIKMSFSEPTAREPVVREISRHGGITRLEPVAEVPVTFNYRWREDDVTLMGLPREGDLYHILDTEGRRIIPPEEGVVLSQRLADNLQVGVGSRIELDSPLLRQGREKVELEVVEVIPQYLGMNAYMSLQGVEEVLGQGEMATALFLSVREDKEPEPGMVSYLNDYYMESELVAGVDGGEDRIRQIKEFMEMAGEVIYLYVTIGIIFSFCIIYTSSFIILSERNRELASMRVLGMTSHEVLSVITFEQWFISFFAVIAGAPLAALINWAFAREFSTDMYTMPAEISVQSLFMGVLITVISIWSAQRFALKKVRELDLVEVLKTRE